MIIALDISTEDTGMAFLRHGCETPSAVSIKPDKKHQDYAKLMDITGKVKAEVIDLAREFPEDKSLDVVVEQPFFISGKSYPGPMFMIHGMLILSLWSQCQMWGVEFSWNEVSVATWRSWLLKHCGVVAASRKSAAQKDATMRALFRLGYTFKDDDEQANNNCADACGIWLWATTQIKGEEK